MKDAAFQKYYAMKPKKKYSKFEEVIDYIVNFRKNHSELESVMMAFYFVTHEIKYDNSYFSMVLVHLQFMDRPLIVIDTKKV